MTYLHIDVNHAQTSKKSDMPCGDAIEVYRSEAATTLIVCDGLGSGIKAHINAVFACARIKELLQEGVSLRKAFNRVVRTMEANKGTDLPYAVVTLARIDKEGNATVLSYEMPPAMIVTRSHAAELKRIPTMIGNATAYESTCALQVGEGVLAVSDGITESGLGEQFLKGWESSGVVQHVNYCLNHKEQLANIPRRVLSKAVEIAGKKHGDDCTVALASCRRGNVLNIMTGPPKKQSADSDVAKQFLELEGSKIICGGTTADLYAREMEIDIDHGTVDADSLAPPISYIEGIDLVCEGAMTLNQALRLVDEDTDSFAIDFAVSELCAYLRNADFINIFVGHAANSAHNDISFRQRGLLPRAAAIEQLATRLRAKGKLVIVEKV